MCAGGVIMLLLSTFSLLVSHHRDSEKHGFGGRNLTVAAPTSDRYASGASHVGTTVDPNLGTGDERTIVRRQHRDHTCDLVWACHTRRLIYIIASRCTYQDRLQFREQLEVGVVRNTRRRSHSRGDAPWRD